MLGSAIGSGPGPRLHSGNTGHIQNHPSALLLHQVESLTAAHKGPSQVRIHHPIKFFGGRLTDSFSTKNSRIVDQNIDPLEPLDSSEYAAQLAQFSMVEQQTKTNQAQSAEAIMLK